jgi:hypothetical protein
VRRFTSVPVTIYNKAYSIASVIFFMAELQMRHFNNCATDALMIHTVDGSCWWQSFELTDYLKS